MLDTMDTFIRRATLVAAVFITSQTADAGPLEVAEREEAAALIDERDALWIDIYNEVAIEFDENKPQDSIADIESQVRSHGLAFVRHGDFVYRARDRATSDEILSLASEDLALDPEIADLLLLSGLDLERVEIPQKSPSYHALEAAMPEDIMMERFKRLSDIIDGKDADATSYYQKRGNSIRVIGGEDAKSPVEADWDGYVRVLSGKDQNRLEVCTGVLITPSKVITSAHCVREYPSQVQVGLTAEQWGQHVYAVKSCDIHPTAFSEISYKEIVHFIKKDKKMNAGRGGCGFGQVLPPSERIKARIANDIAILTLESEIVDIANPRPLLLSPLPIEVKNAMVFGYGLSTAPQNADGTCRISDITQYLAKTRQRMDATILPSKAQITAIRPHGLNTHPNSIFGVACGDSGGPVTITHGSSHEYVIGLISAGMTTSGIADFTVLSANRDFLESHFGPDSGNITKSTDGLDTFQSKPPSKKKASTAKAQP